MNLNRAASAPNETCPSVPPGPAQPASTLAGVLGRVRAWLGGGEAGAGPADRTDARHPGRGRRLREQQELVPCERMRVDLKEVFARVHGSRYVLRHLATLEHELKKRGDAAFDHLPLGVLQKAALQLESLIEPPVPVGVAALRSRLGVALLARERRLPPTEPPVALTTVTAALERPIRPAATRPLPVGSGPTAASARAAERAGADTEPAVLVRERISSYIADGHIEVSEASVSDFEQAVTDWGLLRELPPPPRSKPGAA